MLPTDERSLPNTGRELKPNNNSTCKFFQLNKWCRYGRACRFAHERNGDHDERECQIPTRANKFEDKDTVAASSSGYEDSRERSSPQRHCRFFGKYSWCVYGKACRFTHGQEHLAPAAPALPPQDFGGTQGEHNPPKADPAALPPSAPLQPDRGRRVCAYYKRGYCRYRQNCRYEHSRARKELPHTNRDEGAVQTENSLSTDAETVQVSTDIETVQVSTDIETVQVSTDIETTQVSTDVETVPVSTKVETSEVTSAAVPKCLKREMATNEVDDADLHQLRDVEIAQLKKRFPKDKITENESGDSFKVTVASTDPDWPYDVKEVTLTVQFPPAYPRDCLIVEVGSEANEALPDGLVRHLGNCARSWLSKRHEDNAESGKVELIFLPFLRWLDRNLEEQFTMGLRKSKLELEAEAAGLEFVPYEALPGSLPRADGAEKADPSDVGEEVAQKVEMQLGDKLEGGHSSEPHSGDLQMVALRLDAKIVRKGTEMKLCNLDIGTNVASLHCQKLRITVECLKCKTHQDVSTGPRSRNVFACPKCRSSQQVTFRPSIVHPYSPVLGYLDLEACAAFDLPLVSCVFAVTCLSCNKDMSSDGFHYGKMWQSWCHGCNSKLTICVGCTKFQVLQPNDVADRVPARVLTLEKREKRVKDNSIQEGKPLPDNGTCKHYKKSFRWFRFPCCGKVYPCDLCHDEKESDHEMKRANRVICGFCGKEQAILNNKPCILCTSNMIKVSKAYWEGGKGCRDKAKMSRDDNHKYSGTIKTISRKATEKENATKKKKSKEVKA